MILQITPYGVTRLKHYGIDGCHDGWVVAQGAPGESAPAFSVITDLEALFQTVQRDGSVVAIDIPIGLSDDDARECDQLARQELSPLRHNSVFSAPCRPTLVAETHEEASVLNRQARGVGVTIQTFMIMKKIREVDELMSPETQNHVFEAHPEVVFAALAGGPMNHNKKRKEGALERLAVLRSAGIELTLAPEQA